MRMIVVVGCLVALAGPAWASKPKVAVFGLEVTSRAKPERTDLQVAREATTGLRARAKAGGPYQLAPDAEYELVDVKLVHDCATEAPSCMAKIGRSLGVDALLYGKVQKRLTGKQPGYRVELALLDVSRKAVVTWSGFVPIADASGAKLQAWARKAYAAIVASRPAGRVRVAGR